MPVSDIHDGEFLGLWSLVLVHPQLILVRGTWYLVPGKQDDDYVVALD